MTPVAAVAKMQRESRGRSRRLGLGVGRGKTDGSKEGARPLPKKQMQFSLEIACFVCAIVSKMLNFSPEVVIWWTLNLLTYLLLKMYFGEVVNTLPELWGWYTYY